MYLDYQYHTLIIRMSKQAKGGMEFFKKFADKGGSLFKDMKIKGPKETKNVAQTQTNLAFTEKAQEEAKVVASITKDDFNMKKESKIVQQQIVVEQKSEDLKIRKQTSSKSSENSRETKNNDIDEPTTRIQQQREKEAEEEVIQSKIEAIQPKPLSNLPLRQTVQVKKKVQVLPEPQIEKKKVQKVVVKKQEPEKIIKKTNVSVKQQKKKVQEQKPKKSQRQQVLDELNEYNIKLAQIIINQKNTQNHINQVKAEISRLREQITHWSSQQGYYAEREQYEEADKLQTKIEQTQNKIDQLILELNLGEDQLGKQELQQMNTLKNQNSNMKKMGRKLKLIELALQDDAAVIKREEMEKIQALKTKQQAQKKKISRLQKDISYQNEQILEFEKAIKQDQQVKLNPLIKEKSKLQTSRVTLEAEIKELERRLKQKKTQLSQTIKTLSTIDSSISEINQSFRQENSSLQQRKGKLSNLEKEYSEMKTECSKIEQAIRKQSTSMDEKVSKKLSEANDMAELSKSMEIKHASFDDEVEEWRAIYDSFLQNGKILKQYQQKHQQDKQKFKSLQYKQSGIESQIAKLEQRRDVLKQKIPVIQVQQKKFADLKNYKAAGIKKNQIKQLTEELAKVKEQIQAYVIEEHALGMQLNDLSQSQSSINEEEHQLKKNLAISKHRYLKVKINKIGEYKEAILKNGSSSNKEKEKVIKQLSQIEYRLSEEIIALEKQYKLGEKSPKKQTVQQEQQSQQAELVEEKGASQQQNIVQDEGNQQIDANTGEQHKQENEEGNYYAPPLLEQTQQIEQEDIGYMPLSLD